jgi:fatty-acyl-CoA synthase
MMADSHLVNAQPLRLHSQNLIEMLENGEPDQVPITLLDRQFTQTHRSYRNLLEGARGTAAYLRNRGLAPGDRVLMLVVSAEDFIDAFFGTILAGGIPVAVSPPMTFGDIEKYLKNLGHILENSEARFMISFARIRKLIGSALADSKHLEALFLAKEIQPEQPKQPAIPSLDPDATAFIQYTSGSTGLPKGAMLSHRALLCNVVGIAQGIDCTENDISISWLPLFHDMGLIGSLFTSLYTGAHLYAMQPESFVTDPICWLELITQHRATIATAPNFAYHLMANRIEPDRAKGLDLSSLKVALNGAEPVDLRTLDRFERMFESVGYGDNVSFPVYGMAETCLAATFPPLAQRFEVQPLDREALEAERTAKPAGVNDQFPYQAVSVGTPIQGQEVAIVDAHAQRVAQDQVGQILVRGSSLMLGYYNNPQATDAAIKDDWLHTGDLGFISGDRLFVTGRAKEMIIKRGRNYYPYDIERAASQVAGVRKGCLVAFSVPNPDSGTEDLILVAETREKDGKQQQKIVKQIAAEVLAAVGLRPDQTVLVAPRTLPKTTSGKLQRLLAKKRYEQGRLVKRLAARVVAPVKTLVGSFLGNRRFSKRNRK